MKKKPTRKPFRSINDFKGLRRVMQELLYVTLLKQFDISKALTIAKKNKKTKYNIEILGNVMLLQYVIF